MREKIINLPMGGKLRKTFLKRFKLTKRGKLLRLGSGQSHGFTKKRKSLDKKDFKLASKNFKNYLHYSK